MKKPLVVVGAVASAFTLSAVPAVVPALGMAAYAAEQADGTTITLAQREALLAEVEAKFPDVEAWGSIANFMDAFENNYGCYGMGCVAQEAGILLRDGKRNDIIAEALTAAGVDSSKMTDVEKLAAAKGIAKYTSDAEFKAVIDNIEAEIKTVLIGPDEPMEGGGDMTPLVDMLADMKNGLSAESTKGKTIYEVIAQINKIPGYAEYSALGKAYFPVKYWINDSTTQDQINEYYNELVSKLAAAEAYEAAQAKAPETVTTTNELKALVEKTKANPEYQKYEKLVRNVHDAEALLESLKTPTSVNGKARTARNENNTAIMTLAVAREVAAEDDATTAEIVATIKALGDAMRNVGVKTTLGEGLTTATVDDLAKAIETARGVEKFTQYEELVEAIDAAEAAIASGVTDATTLKQVLANVQQLAKKVLPPDTGVAPVENTEISAVANFSTSAIVATIATTIGAAVILKRRFANKN